MEEFDLRPYLLALRRRWPIILLAMVAAVVLAIVLTLIQQPAYTARTGMVILPNQSELAFDERFITNDIPVDTTNTARQDALVGLASSLFLEEQVLAKLPDEYIPQDYEPGDLLRRIRIATQGDLLTVTARGQDAQSARVLADVWGETFITLTHDLFADNQVLLQEVDEQIEAAEEQYAAAQQALEEFIGSSELVQLQQQITKLEELLDDSREANQALYTVYVSRTHELELILEDAQTLRDQVATNGNGEFASSLAFLAIRARTVGDMQLPIDLQFDDPDAFAQSEEVSTTTLDAFIDIIQERHVNLLDQSQELSEAIATGEVATAGLSTAQSAQYEEALTVLEQRYEQQTAQQRHLRQQRDLALESLAILQRKLNEQRIVQGTSQTEVRMVSTVVAPPDSLIARLVMNGAIALLLGFFLGVVLILVQEIIKPRTVAQPAVAGTEHAVDRSVTN